MFYEAWPKCCTGSNFRPRNGSYTKTQVPNLFQMRLVLTGLGPGWTAHYPFYLFTNRWLIHKIFMSGSRRRAASATYMSCANWNLLHVTCFCFILFLIQTHALHPQLHAYVQTSWATSEGQQDMFSLLAICSGGLGSKVATGWLWCGLGYAQICLDSTRSVQGPWAEEANIYSSSSSMMSICGHRCWHGAAAVISFENFQTNSLYF